MILSNNANAFSYLLHVFHFFIDFNIALFAFLVKRTQ